MEFSEKEQKHKRILEAVTKICRSDKKGFIQDKTPKLDVIRELLLDSGYHEILLPNAQIWRKDFSAPIDVIVSSHADVVENITTCSSSLLDTGYYKGTYDNAGPAAAAIISMLEENMPSNITFSFTADEETGRCNGAKQVLEYARNAGNEPLCIALDVTYEGYDEGYLYTVENLSSGDKKEENMQFLNKIAKAMTNLEPEDKQGCKFVKLSKKAIPDALDKKYIARSSGWFDEAQAFVNEHAGAFSLCLPCKGNMHANSGVLVREPVFEGYINALTYITHTLAKSQEAEAILLQKKSENENYINKSLEMVAAEEKEAQEQRKRYVTYHPHYKSYNSGEMTEDEYYDYLAYNESFGNYQTDEYLREDSWYNPEIYSDFSDYVNSVIEEVVETLLYEDDYESEYDFIEEMMSSLPEDIIDYYGGEKNMRRVLADIYHSSYDDEIENENSEEDEDDYEYTSEY